MLHELKSNPHSFTAFLSGHKRFDLRKWDRLYAVGDTLRICEFDPQANTLTGRRMLMEVTYVMTHISPDATPGLAPGFCLIGLRFIEIESL